MNKRSVLSLVVLLLAISFGYAEAPKDKKSSKSVKRALAEGCAPATSQADLNINNVRARMLGSGDMWWDLNLPQYEVPKGSNRHSMFAGALWLGGIDEADNLRLAAMTYRQDGVDYWPGPLTDGSASVTSETCERYNRHWMVFREEVEIHKEWVECKLDPNCNLADRFPGYVTPQSIIQWPGNGVDGELPNKLAPYFETDQGTPGVYEPDFDYPGYDIDGTEDCRLKETDLLYGDQTLWWVYNDKGNTHTETQAAALGFEIRAQAFAFTSNDEVNNMTFNNYRILNKSTFRLTDTYFGTWFDADLGNAFDDIIGCDIARGLGYVYNGDSDDDGARGYGLNPPAIGFDFFQGPFADYFDGIDNDRDGCIDGVRDDKGVCQGENPVTGLNERIIMSGFMYYNNSSGFTGPQAMTDPDNGQEFYNYLRNRWRNGNNLIIESPSGKGNTNNGDGFVGSNQGTATFFAYPGLSFDTTGAYPPLAPVDWWESPSNLADKRGLHNAGPFSLAPGALNFITTGAVWARNFRSNDLFASVNDVIVADDKAQQLFDNCFNVLDGPRSPELEIIELDRQLVLNLKNAFNERTIGYEEIDPAIPPQPGWDAGSIDSALQEGYFSYKFEGFQIFQVSGPDVGIENLYDQSQSRLIWQSDIQNDIGQLVNFEVNPDLENNALEPQDMTIIANNNGIELSFSVTEDAFAEGDQQLVNGREYYFYVIAYSQNNYIPTDPRDLGKNSQKRPYLAGRNIGNNQKPYLGIPNQLNSYVTNSEWGDGLPITRFAGGGNSGNYERITDESRNRIAVNGKVDEVDYLPGAGPIDVKVVDPRAVVPDDYIIEFEGTDPDSKWRLFNSSGELIDSSRFGLSFLGEQLIDNYGISIATRNVVPPGLDTLQIRNNGFIGAEIIYDDASLAWLSGVPDDGTISPTNWLLSGTADNPDQPEESYNAKRESGFLPDPFGVFETILQGTFGPSGLLSDVSAQNTDGYGVSPSLIPVLRPKTANLTNIDIVITKDHTKWTRVPVIELGDDANANEGGTQKFRLRSDPTMNKDANGNLTPASDGSTGWSYFPGYAVNTQTGRRLHIAFGENSWLKSENGGDMIWNPSPDIFRKLGSYGLGGMHMLYIFADSVDLFSGIIDLTYDPAVHEDPANHPLAGRFNNPSDIYSSMVWAGFPLVAGPQYEFYSYQDIPTDVRIEVRMDRPFKKTKGSDPNGGNPMYGFSTMGSAPDDFTPERINSALDLIRVVPNPYYGGSEYEDSQLENIVKITNLPNNCTINIFMTNGTLVRTIDKANSLTFVEWDLTNNFGVPISSGIYLIHIDAGEGGQKVVKWMGAMRPIDLNAF